MTFLHNFLSHPIYQESYSRSSSGQDGCCAHETQGNEYGFKSEGLLLICQDLEKSAEQTELEAYKPSRDQQAAEICDEIDAAQLALIAEERRKRDAT